MSMSSDFFLQQAATCARDAEKASLQNVRERLQRSEAAWRAMADKIILTEKMRSMNESDKTQLVSAIIDGQI